jgi:hypothetical protein
MSDAFEAGEVELWTTPLGKWFPRAEMMAGYLADARHLNEWGQV